jgi:hypothetical protein
MPHGKVLQSKRRSANEMNSVYHEATTKKFLKRYFLKIFVAAIRFGSASLGPKTFARKTFSRQSVTFVTTYVDQMS